MMEPVLVTVFAWQSAHLVKSLTLMPACAGVLGGMPWHDPHTACAVPPVQLGLGMRLGATSRAAAVPAPWQ